MSKDHDALKAFARDIIQGMWDGGIAGSDVQELAVKHGLIESCVATEEDAHNNSDIVKGDFIFRYVDWMQK